MTRRIQTQAATAVALAWSIFEGDDFDVERIELSFATTLVLPEDLTVTLNSHLGAGSDVVLLTIPGNDMVGADEIIIKNLNGFVNGDTVDIAFTNTDTSSITGTAGTQIITREEIGEPEKDAEIEYYIDGVRQIKTQVLGGNVNNFVTNTITFVNDTTPVVVFTVTGDVVVKIVPVCKTNLTSAGACNAELGTATTVAAMIAATDVTTIDAGEIWHDATADSNIEALSVAREFIVSGGEDIELTLSGQIDAGAIAFYCHWYPLSSDGNVVAA